jgi:hypothetical protein
MSRYGLYYLLKYHSNTVHRLISKQFNDVSVIIKRKKSYIYSKNNNQIAWIWYKRNNKQITTRIYINKKLSYQYNQTYLEVHVYDIGLSFDTVWHLSLFIHTPDGYAYNVDVDNQDMIMYGPKLIRTDPIKCILDLYQWFLHSRNFTYLREDMDKKNIKYK